MRQDLVEIESFIMRTIINDTYLYYRIMNIINYMQKLGVFYFFCSRSYLGNVDFGRYIKNKGYRVILVANDPGISSAEIIDTIVHESIHFAGERLILNRNKHSSINRNSVLYNCEEYIALKATKIICTHLGVYSLVPPPVIGDISFSFIRTQISNKVDAKVDGVLNNFCTAAVENILLGKINKIGRLEVAIDPYILSRNM